MIEMNLYAVVPKLNVLPGNESDLLKKQIYAFELLMNHKSP